MITFWKDKTRPSDHHCQGQPLAECPKRGMATLNLIMSLFAGGAFLNGSVPGVT